MQQLPALVGVLVGAFAATGGAVLAERVRWRREYDRRWDANRLAVVVAYARAVKIETRLCLRVAASRWPGTANNPLSIVEGAPLVSSAVDDRSAALEPLLLLADADTVNAARRWHMAVRALHVVLDENHVKGHDDFLELYRLAGVARDDFYEVARRALDVGGGAVRSHVVTWDVLQHSRL